MSATDCVTDGDAMATIAVWLKVDGERVADDVQDAWEKLHSADGDVVLDFSSVRRIDSNALSAMDRLVTRADEHAIKVVLRGVNVEVYKVLTLVKLAPRFCFVT
jgi:anti-anti-sigma regulatory factor